MMKTDIAEPGEVRGVAINLVLRELFAVNDAAEGDQTAGINRTERGAAVDAFNLAPERLGSQSLTNRVDVEGLHEVRHLATINHARKPDAGTRGRGDTGTRRQGETGR